MATPQENINEQQKPVIPEITPIQKPQKQIKTELGSQPVPGLDGQFKTTADIIQPKQPDGQITTDLKQPKTTPVKIASGQEFQLTAQEMKIREQGLKNQGLKNQEIQPKQPDGQITTDLRDQKQPKTIPQTIASGQEFQLTAQEMKIKEQGLKNQEIQTKQQERQLAQQEKQTKMTDLSNFLVGNPTKDAVNRYLKINYKPEYKEDYQGVLRNYYKQQNTKTKAQKYSVAPVEVIDQAVKSGDLIPGSDAFNMLPAEKIQEYNQYSSRKQASELTNKYTAPTVDFTSILDGVSKIFSTNYKKEFADKLKSPEITGLQTEMSGIETKIQEIDDKIEYKGEDRAKVSKGVPSSLQERLNTREKQALIREKNTLINQYNSKLNTLNSLKEDINTELEIAKADDENARNTYTTALGIYQTERGRMDAIEMANFEAENKLLAEQRANDFTLKMTQIEQNFQKDMKLTDQEYASKKPEYQIGRDGQMYAISNGVATVVMSDLGTPLFGEEKENSSQQAYKNEDGTISVVTTYKDGRSPTMTTLGVNGQSVNGNLSVNDVIAQCRESGQCGEGAYDYLNKLGVRDTNGNLIRVGSNYDKPDQYGNYKTRLINSDTPEIGGLAIWNPNGGTGKYKENGHIGIVTGVNDDGTVTITHWNYNEDEKQTTDKIPLETINYNGGFFNTSKPIPGVYEVPETQKEYTESQRQVMNSIDSPTSPNALKTLESAGLTANDWGTYQTIAKTPTREQEKQRQDILDSIDSFLTDTSLGAGVGLLNNAFIPGTKGYTYKKKFESFRDKIVLPNLGQLKGPMSDKDIAFLRNTATYLDTSLNEEDFKKGLEDLKNTFLNKWGITQEQTQTSVKEANTQQQTQGGSTVNTTGGYSGWKQNSYKNSLQGINEVF